MRVPIYEVKILSKSSSYNSVTQFLQTSKPILSIRKSNCVTRGCVASKNGFFLILILFPDFSSARPKSHFEDAVNFAAKLRK